MFSQRLQDAINSQINAELHSAYIYLSMSAYLDSINLPGFSAWMRLQHDEEQIHAMKLFDFMLERDGKVVLSAIAAPPIDFESPLDIFEKALAHEKKVTGLINDLYDVAVEEGDYPTQVLLQWFIEEQVEEEKSASDAVEQLRMVGDFAPGILMMDREMGARQAEPAA